MSLLLFGLLLISVFLSLLSFDNRLLIIGNMVICFGLSLINYYEVVLLGAVKHQIVLSEYLRLGSHQINLEFFMDYYSSQMVYLVCFISLLVHLYSLVYLRDDPRLNLFLTYLTVFTFFMLVYLVSLNFVQLFIGWEGIGISSYLLVNFWHTRLHANKAGLKALFVNRVGDYFFLFGLLLVSARFVNINLPSLAVQTHYVEVAFFLLAACAKSSQLGLHTWLPDAMEGPTPVSALIHAATMVTAGIYLLLRVNTYQIEFLLGLLGGLTTVYAGLCALFQTDLKRVIAYSTCAQLGYMISGLSLGAPTLTLYHLINHAYFKALLFLTAGLIIHALNNEQDLRRMGGLYQRTPVIYVCFLVGNLALSGFPFLTGYYSKDNLLEVAYSRGSFFVYFCLLLGAYLTVLYSWRVLVLVFWSAPKFNHQQSQTLHDTDYLSLGVVLVLGVSSVLIGYLTRDLAVGLGQTNELVPYNYSEFYCSHWIKLLPFTTFSLAIVTYYLPVVTTNRGWANFISKRFAFDLADAKIVQLGLRLSYFSYAEFERGLLEEVGTTGVNRLTFYVYQWTLATGWFTTYFSLLGLGLTLIASTDFSLVGPLSLLLVYTPQEKNDKIKPKSV